MIASADSTALVFARVRAGGGEANLAKAVALALAVPTEDEGEAADETCAGSETELGVGRVREAEICNTTDAEAEAVLESGPLGT